MARLLVQIYKALGILERGHLEAQKDGEEEVSAPGRAPSTPARGWRGVDRVRGLRRRRTRSRSDASTRGVAPVLPGTTPSTRTWH